MAITQIALAGQQRLFAGSDYRSLPDIARRVKTPIVVDMTIEQRNHLDILEDWQYINIPTQDFQCPNWNAQQWINLTAFIANETDHEDSNEAVLFVACQGGQGRTGIALAILYATITENFVNPVKLIRQFNPHFIETPAQEAYVKRIVKEIELLTEPAVVIEPIYWPARVGKAEKRVAELEAELSNLKAEYKQACAEIDEYIDMLKSIQEITGKVAKG